MPQSTEAKKIVRAPLGPKTVISHSSTHTLFPLLGLAQMLQCSYVAPQARLTGVLHVGLDPQCGTT